MTEQERQDLEKTRDMFAGIALRYYLIAYEDMQDNELILMSYDFADLVIAEKLKRLKQRAKSNHPANVNETKGIDSMGEWE